MNEYPKIHSLWKRKGWYFDQDKKKSPDYQQGRQSFIFGDYAEPEFGNIKKWAVDEKIDGTNIRIFFERIWPVENAKSSWKIKFGGRTADAQIPCHLLDYLQITFTPELLETVFTSENCSEGCLYGEGYGPKIQSCGDNYRENPGFMLFDIKIGTWWLKRQDMRDIAEKLGIPSVPDLGIMTEEEIIKFIKSKPISRCSRNPQMMEGIIARSEPLMMFRKGAPIMWKLKCKEF